MKVAIYGKGGIGKSTITSNLSAILASEGKKILQIGCDPKHDSTILLNPDGNSSTLLDILANEDENNSDFLKVGRYGIHCVEIGGPKPGVGCAGRGIIKGTSYLLNEGILDNDYDCILYDVLGDVVCGGFFQPLKEQLVDVMYIVSSGEFNSLFAANNLCKGYINSQLADRNVKLGGLIGNCRGIKNEEKILHSFAKKVNIPLIGTIPRDNRIEESTFKGIPVIEKYEDSDITKIFRNIANIIVQEHDNNMLPVPIELEEMRKIYEQNYLGE